MIRFHTAPHTHPRSRSASFAARSLHVLLVACTCILLVVWLVYLVRVEALFSSQTQGHSLRRRAKGLFSGGMPSPFGRGADKRGNGLGPQLEVWARGPNQQAAGSTEGPRQHLSESEQLELRSLCGRTLYHTLQGSVHMYTPQGAPHAFVATGDIPDQWIRDSSVQMGVLLPRIAQHPALRQLVDAAILRQASFILADPWANSFREAKVLPGSLHMREQRMGRGGWVATRNYEVDSGAYFINLLWNYYHTPGLWGREQVLNSSVVHDAVLATISTWQTEQHHEDMSPYRYVELPRHGRGPKTGYTGMVWGGFRPSDDPQVYGYNIPANMYTAGALDNALWLNRHLWHCPVIQQKAARLAADIRTGIEQYGIVSVEAGAGSDDSVKVYAYEVDGLGNQLADFDDPNLPSLLAMPLLGYSGYDEQVYRATRDRILSTANPYYYQGPLGAGCGSPHSSAGYAWPLAIMVDALTSSSTRHQALTMRQLLGMQCGNGLMHESFDVRVDNLTAALKMPCTREIFEWANAMLVALVEETLGLDCDAEAQRLHLEAIRERWGQTEAGIDVYRNHSIDTVTAQRNAHPIVDSEGGDFNDYPLFYARMEQHWDLP